MNTLINKKYSICILILLLSNFCNSCYDESSSKCSKDFAINNVRIYFSNQTTNALNKLLNPKDVKSLTLFVFDINGKFVKSKTDNNISLNAEYYMDLQLNSGTYTFVAWGNLNDPYTTSPPVFESNISDINTSVLYLKRPSSNIMTTIIPHLFFGNYLSAKIDQTTSQEFEIKLNQNTNKINLTVRGLPYNNDLYNYLITDSNTKYNFDNSFAVDSEFSYMASGNLDNNYLFKSSLVVLRLADNRNVNLELFNATKNKSIYKHNLIDLLKRLESVSPIIDYENVHEYNIELKLYPNLEVQVIINGWTVINDHVQLP